MQPMKRHTGTRPRTVVDDLSHLNASLFPRFPPHCLLQAFSGLATREGLEPISFHYKLPLVKAFTAGSYKAFKLYWCKLHNAHVFI